jgi:hypothetical protein
MGTIRAFDESEARRVGSLVDDLAPKVAAELDSDLTVLPPLQVWLPRDHTDNSWKGWTNAERVWMLTNDEGQFERHCLAHEIAHYYIFNDPGRRWSRLPPIANEGLAELTALRVVPDTARHRLEMFRRAFEDARGRKDLEFIWGLAQPAWRYSHPEGNPDLYYGMAVVLAAALGNDGLARLRPFLEPFGRSEAPRHMLRAARVDVSNPTQWEALLESHFGFPASTPSETGRVKAVLRAADGTILKELLLD